MTKTILIVFSETRGTRTVTYITLSWFLVVFMLIGFIIFGAKHYFGDLNWSFAFSVIGSVFCLIASVLAVVQMKQSNVI